MKRVIAVHKTFSLKTKKINFNIGGRKQHKTKNKKRISSTTNLNWIFLSGFCISGNMEQNGFTNSRNFIPILRPRTQPTLPDYL